MSLFRRALYLLVVCNLAYAQTAELYPGSTVDYEKEKEGSALRLYLSQPKRVSNTLRFEKEERVKGKRQTWLLRLDDVEDTRDVWQYYLKLIEERGELLYSCEHRACGTSSNWANKLFEESKLTGRDDNQYYAVGTYQNGEAPGWLSVYVVKNGRRQNYAYVQLTIPEKATPAFVLNTLQTTPDLDSDFWSRLQEAHKNRTGQRLLVRVYFEAGDSYDLAYKQAQTQGAWLTKEVSARLKIETSAFSVLIAGPLRGQAESTGAGIHYSFKYVAP